MDKSKTAIMCTGAFDLLHAGHLHLLKTAKALADACGGFVVCLVNSDESIRASKGADRPRQTAQLRQANIWDSGILDFSVDIVQEFHRETTLGTVCAYYEPIRLIGSDYLDQPITGAEHCKAVLFIKRTDDSTTKTIQSLADR